MRPTRRVGEVDKRPVDSQAVPTARERRSRSKRRSWSRHGEAEAEAETETAHGSLGVPVTVPNTGTQLSPVAPP